MWLLVGLWGCAPAVPVALAVCEGAWTTRVDGVVSETGRRMLDADGNILEEEIHLPGLATVRFVQDWHDGLLARWRADSDGDGVFEEENVYWYDGDRLVLEERTYQGETAYTEHAYDRDGNRISAAHFWGNQLQWTTRWTWIDGRMQTGEQTGPEGGVITASEWTYPEPAPSLDHEFTMRSALGDVTYLRGFDGAGHLLWEEARPAEGQPRWTARRWDGDLQVEGWSLQPGWDGTSIVSGHSTWDYGDDERIDLYVSDAVTTAADGTVETSHVEEEWTWGCAPG